MTFSSGTNTLPDDRLLIDKIIVDLGDDVPAPTTPPPTSTENPIEGDTVVNLKTNMDYLGGVWETNCHYTDEYTYLRAFGKGCAVVPTAAIPGDFSEIGFWSPCSGRTCRIRYVSNPEVVSNVPSSLSLKTYTEGNASVSIIIQDVQYADSETCANCQLIDTVKIDAGWKETNFALLKRPSMHYVSRLQHSA